MPPTDILMTQTTTFFLSLTPFSLSLSLSLSLSNSQYITNAHQQHIRNFYNVTQREIERDKICVAKFIRENAEHFLREHLVSLYRIPEYV